MNKMGKDDFKLENCDEEEILNVIKKLEKSFNIKFSKTAFMDVKTFGDVCDVFESHLHCQHEDNCTAQQAFYKIRKALGITLVINERQINIDSALTDVFPMKNRRGQIKEFRSYLGLKINLLTYPDWFASVFTFVFFASLVAFFFDWKIAVSGILAVILSSKIAQMFGKVLRLATIQQLTEKCVTEHYSEVRRKKGTINKTEIPGIIRNAFSRELSLPKEVLTKDSKI